VKRILLRSISEEIPDVLGFEKIRENKNKTTSKMINALHLFKNNKKALYFSLNTIASLV